MTVVEDLTNRAVKTVGMHTHTCKLKNIAVTFKLKAMHAGWIGTAKELDMPRSVLDIGLVKRMLAFQPIWSHLTILFKHACSY